MGIALLVVGAVLLLVGALAQRERLPRNPLVGIRIPATLRSDQAWRAGHRAAAPEMMIIGVGSLVAGSLALSFPTVGLVAIIALLGALVHNASVAHRAAEAADGER